MSGGRVVAQNAHLAVQAAKRLHATATAILIVASALAGLGALGGIVASVLGHTSSQRIVGLIVVAGCVFVWLLAILPCLAAQAVARYIRLRSEPDGPRTSEATQRRRPRPSGAIQ